MKRVVLTLCLMLGMAGFQQLMAQTKRLPFEIGSEQLQRFLRLDDQQTDRVRQINNYFKEMQQQALDAQTPADRKTLLDRAVVSHLSHLRQTLTPAQYTKYCQMLVNTNSNNREEGNYAFDEALLKEETPK